MLQWLKLFYQACEIGTPKWVGVTSKFSMRNHENSHHHHHHHHILILLYLFYALGVTHGSYTVVTRRPWVSLSSSQVLRADQPFLSVRARHRLVSPQHVDLFYRLYAEFVLSPIRLWRNANVSKMTKTIGSDLTTVSIISMSVALKLTLPEVSLTLCQSLIKSSDLFSQYH